MTTTSMKWKALMIPIVSPGINGILLTYGLQKAADALVCKLWRHCCTQNVQSEEAFSYILVI